MLRSPSFLAHSLNGLLIFSLVIILLVNYFGKNKIVSNEIISIILLFSIAIGVHGISHLLQEVYYNWNPLQTILY